MNTLHQPIINYHQEVKQSLAVNDIDKAASICAKGLQHNPTDAQLWSDLSEISMQTGNTKMAINCALKAIDSAPSNVWYVFNLAGCYLHLQVFAPAIKALDHSETLLDEKSDANQWDKLGELRYMADQLDKAIAAHSRALLVEDDSVRSRNQLGALLRFKGDLKEAERLFREVIDLEPANYHACYNLSQLRRFKHDDNIIALLTLCKNLLEADHVGHIMLQYALGKVYEDFDQYEQAFNHYTLGAELKRKQRPYNIDKDLALMESIVEFSDAQSLTEDIVPNIQQTPIFIVGLPRTGTTLVERIIASHPNVVSGGELNAFPMALLEAGGKPLAAGLDGLDDSLMKNLTSEALQKIGERYLQIANNTVKGASVFIDKLPYNFLYCGLIRKAIPNAKIIHVKRNHFDAAFSNYKMLFDRGYEYSYNQEDTANFIAAYDKLMSKWKSRFSDQIHTIAYEELVNSQHQQTQKLLEFCDLEWDEKCIDFHNNGSASQTASASQIREPIYNRSVNLWRKYEQQLTLLLSTFKKHGISPEETGKING